MDLLRPSLLLVRVISANLSCCCACGCVDECCECEGMVEESSGQKSHRRASTFPLPYHTMSLTAASTLRAHSKATARLLSRRSFQSRPPSPVEGAYDPHNALVCLAPTPLVLPVADKGPLKGWTVSVKDNICTADMPTSCASAMLQGEQTVTTSIMSSPLILLSPGYTSTFEATAVTKLRQAGALVVGKTNCDEFGMG